LIAPRMAEPVKRIWKHYRIATESSLVVLGLVATKLLVERLGWEFVGQNALYTSIIAGGIFLFGLILTRFSPRLSSESPAS
jgi:predicted tellurium resistance membrane protein TerC